jgi:hypothetical protein
MNSWINHRGQILTIMPGGNGFSKVEGKTHPTRQHHK